MPGRTSLFFVLCIFLYKVFAELFSKSDRFPRLSRLPQCARKRTSSMESPVTS